MKWEVGRMDIPVGEERSSLQRGKQKKGSSKKKEKPWLLRGAKEL